MKEYGDKPQRQLIQKSTFLPKEKAKNHKETETKKEGQSCTNR